MQERKKVNLDAGVLYDATVFCVNPLKCQKWQARIHTGFHRFTEIG